MPLMPDYARIRD